MLTIERVLFAACCAAADMLISTVCKADPDIPHQLLACANLAALTLISIAKTQPNLLLNVLRLANNEQGICWRMSIVDLNWKPKQAKNESLKHLGLFALIVK